MQNSRAVSIIHLVYSVLVTSLAQVPHNHSIHILLYLVFLFICFHARFEHTVEIAKEGFMTQLNVQLLNDILDYEELAELYSLFESFLDVPKHQVVQLFVLDKNFLETIQVSLNSAIKH